MDSISRGPEHIPDYLHHRIFAAIPGFCIYRTRRAMFLKKRLPSFIAAFFVCALLAPLAQAGEPSEVVRKGIHGVLDILGQPDLKAPEKKEERRNRMRKVIHRYFDFEEMSRRSLARAWRKRTPKERAEFTDLFSYFMERNYASTLESYTNEKVVFGKETSDAEFAKVNTLIITTDKKEVDILYRLHKVGGEWRVYDVLVEGVSLVKNYRDQFRSIIRRTSYANLVKILRAKRDEG